jgi:hypothetical protein
MFTVGNGTVLSISHQSAIENDSPVFHKSAIEKANSQLSIHTVYLVPCSEVLTWCAITLSKKILSSLTNKDKQCRGDDAKILKKRLSMIYFFVHIVNANLGLW